jgi:hypothetical protein
MNAKAEVIAICESRGWTTSRRGSWITIHTGGDSPQFSGYEFNGYAAALEAVRELTAKLDARNTPAGWDHIEPGEESIADELDATDIMASAIDDEADSPEGNHDPIADAYPETTDPNYVPFGPQSVLPADYYDSRSENRPTSPTTAPETPARGNGEPTARTSQKASRAVYPRSLTEWVSGKIGTPANRKNRRKMLGQVRTN